VDAGDELEVLAHREVVVEREALRHVADPRLDLLGFAADVEAEAGAAPGVGREQAAQHADGRGLSRAVRPEEAVDQPALDPHGEVAHHGAAGERFGQTLAVDRDVGRGGHDVGHRGHRLTSGFFVSWSSSTSTGWPTRMLAGATGSASIRNTSFERSSRL